MANVFHVVDFIEVGASGGRRRPVPACGTNECISADTERDLELDDVFALLSKHVEGDKAAGPALVPATFAYGSGPVTREAGNVIGGPAFAVLDSDRLTPEKAAVLWGFVYGAGYRALAYSTHSNGKLEDDGSRYEKFRLVVALDRTLTSAREVKQVRKGLCLYLADIIEVSEREAFDPACSDPNRLFYFPRFDAARREHVFVWESKGSLTFSADAMLGYADERSNSIVSEVAAGKFLDGNCPPDLRNACLDDLTQLHHRIATSPGDTLRTTVLGRYMPLIGGYVEMGALSEDEVVKALSSALQIRAKRFPGEDDHGVDERLQTALDLLEWGRRKPLMPRGYTAEGARDESVKRTSYYGLERARKELAEAPRPTLVSVEKAAEILHATLRLPRPRHGVRTDIVRVTTGAGKTFALRQLAQERAARGEHTVIFSENHGLLGQLARDMRRAGTPVYHHYGVEAAAAKTGGDECERLAAREKRVVRLQQAGSSIARTVCPTCPLQRECKARKNSSRSPWDANDYVTVLPYAAMSKIAQWQLPDDTYYAYDEQPPDRGQIVITSEAIEDVLSGGLLRLAGDGFGNSVREFGRALLDRLDPDPQVLARLASLNGRPVWHDHSDSDLRAYARDRATVAALLETATALVDSRDRVTALDEHRLLVKPVNPVYEFLREHNVTVLSATPNMNFYRGLRYETHTVAVHDFHTTPRIMVYRPATTRRHLMPGGIPDVAVVDGHLSAALDLIPPKAKTLVVAAKRLAEAARDGAFPALSGREFTAVHHEITLGRDDWSDYDAIVTVGDSLRPPRILEDGTVSWQESIDAARDLACQAQARTRDVQPRTTPALHVHIGQHVPRTWNTDNCLLLRAPAPDGSFTSEQRDAMFRLQTIYGQVEAAKKLGAAPKTFRGWLAGGGTRPDKIADVLARLGDAVVEVEPVAEFDPSADVAAPAAPAIPPLPTKRALRPSPNAVESAPSVEIFIERRGRKNASNVVGVAIQAAQVVPRAMAGPEGPRPS